MAKGYQAHKARAEALQKLGRELARRSKSCCELCGENTSLTAYEVSPVPDMPEAARTLFICDTCQHQLAGKQALEPRHWYPLQEKIWSEYPVVQVMAWRMLQQLKAEPWAQDLLDQMYLEEDTLHWAQNP